MTISFDDFKKLDIRIVKIVSAEKVEGTGKLLKLKVELGSEDRQLIAGIAEVYQPEDLIGKEVPMLVNLEPKKFKGLESQGMILAADDNGKPVLLHPDREIPAGSIVR